LRKRTVSRRTCPLVGSSYCIKALCSAPALLGLFVTTELTIRTNRIHRITETIISLSGMELQAVLPPHLQLRQPQPGVPASYIGTGSVKQLYLVCCGPSSSPGLAVPRFGVILHPGFLYDGPGFRRTGWGLPVWGERNMEFMSAPVAHRSFDRYTPLHYRVFQWQSPRKPR
jgi:hypothetical protein